MNDTFQSSFTIDIRPEYLLVRFDPGFIFTPEVNERLWPAIGEERNRTGLNRVLIVSGKANRRMTTLDGFRSATLAAERLPGAMAAFCIDGYEVDSLTEFFCKAANSRGLKVKFCGELDEACHWLGLNEATVASEFGLSASISL